MNMGWDHPEVMKQIKVPVERLHIFSYEGLLILPVLYIYDSSQIPGLQSNILIKLPGLMSCFV